MGIVTLRSTSLAQVFHCLMLSLSPVQVLKTEKIKGLPVFELVVLALSLAERMCVFKKKRAKVPVLE